MSKRTIPKFAVFVILAAGCSILSSCARSAQKGVEPSSEAPYHPARVIATIQTEDLKEASGLAVSRCQENVIWTHNDSGDDANLFAIGANGEYLATYRVASAENQDWEDIAGYKDAAGRCWLYIGDIGNNNGERPTRTIYRIAEPDVRSTASGTIAHAGPAERIDYSYPDGRPDAEALLVHPGTAEVYVVTKQVKGPAGVYRIKRQNGQQGVVTAEFVGRISVPAIPNGLITGGDISPDGRRVVLCDYAQAYEYSLGDGTKNFDSIWQSPPTRIDIGKRKNGEAIAYTAAGDAVLATSEKKNPPLIEARRK